VFGLTAAQSLLCLLLLLLLLLARPAGLGVAKFLVQLGVFASVLYTLLALDIDPVEQLVKLLPISEVCGCCDVTQRHGCCCACGMNLAA
jgi:hypothetical protein